MFYWLAAMFFDHGAARCTDGELPVDVVEGVDECEAKKDLNQARKVEYSHVGHGWTEGHE